MRTTRPVSPPVTPLAALWSPRSLLGCLLFGEGVAAILVLATGRAGWVFFGLASLALQWIMLLTLGGLYVGRHRLAAASSSRVATVALIGLLGSTAVVLAIASTVMPTLAEAALGGWMGLAIRTLGIVAMVGGLAIAAFRSQWDARQSALRTKQAELDVLHARIRPHFLFNTLNTATALVHSHPDDAERVLLDLSDLFRAALGKKAVIDVAEELALTRRYLGIESSRFGERLRVDWQVPDTLPAVTVPPLSIQPLVENAVRHGIEPAIDGGLVSVHAIANAGWLVIEIRNPVAPAGVALNAGHGVGLRASIARIEDSTQGRGRVSLMCEGDVFVTRLELPVDD